MEGLLVSCVTERPRPFWNQFWRYVEWVQFLMLNNAWISPSLKNFQGAQEWGVFGKIFTKFHKIFFCLRGLNAGAIIQKKFGFLDLPWKFCQNPCNRSRDMAVFRQGMFSKTSTFHLNSHISLANLAHKFLLLGLKILYFTYLLQLVGCCRPNGSGVMTIWSWIDRQKGTPRPIFKKIYSGDPFFFMPLQEFHPDSSLYLSHKL